MQITTHNKLHQWLKIFSSWIAPDSKKQEDISNHAKNVISTIKQKAEEDGLTVLDAKISGSFAKGTGLRRHLRGNSEVEGQDVDLVFILKKEKDDDGNLKCLIPAFKKFAEEAYPDSEHPPLTKSSAPIHFKGKKLSYDLVPLYKESNTKQTLARTDGEERSTSVIKHVEFTHSRVTQSDEAWGVVKFSHMVRLFKWWRYHQQTDSGVFGNDEDDESVPSFLLDLLCAEAFDKCDVCDTYPETLAMWLSHLEGVVSNRTPVIFIDNYRTGKIDESAYWTVLDPVDKENNIVGNTNKWDERAIDELAEWLSKSKDCMNRALRLINRGKEAQAKEQMEKIFGSAFSNHNEEE